MSVLCERKTQQKIVSVRSVIVLPEEPKLGKLWALMLELKLTKTLLHSLMLMILQCGAGHQNNKISYKLQNDFGILKIILFKCLKKSYELVAN